MSERKVKNFADSVRQRLLNIARQTNRPFQEVLQRYAMERFLYRLSVSGYSENFILKGGLLLAVCGAAFSRVTKDIDLRGDTCDVEKNIMMVKEICIVEVEDDGLKFSENTVKGERIIEEADYEGVRVNLRGNLGQAEITLLIDIGYGDKIVPGPGKITYPALLEPTGPILLGYSRESVIAEKLHVMVKWDELNSRMKDFYDIWFLSQHYSFDASLLAEAIRETFANRKTAIPAEPTAFTREFAEKPEKQKQWSAFIRRNRVENAPLDFSEVVSVIADFLHPIIKAITEKQALLSTWSKAERWK